MKKKFKKILSLVTVVTLLVSMLSFWAVPASAVQGYDVVSPGGSIDMPYYTYYYEVVLTDFTSSWSDVSLYIPQSGTVIIQSFGHNGGFAPYLMLLNSNGTEILCQDPQGFKNDGYRNQTLLSFNNEEYGSYILRIKGTSNNMRLSITVAEETFLGDPISQYEDIPYLEGSMTRRFYYDTAAMVALYQPYEGQEFFTVTASGFSGMRTFVLNPMTTNIYDIMEIEGEDSLRVPLPNDSITYYVVVFIPIGNGDGPGIEIEYADLTIAIG